MSDPQRLVRDALERLDCAPRGPERQYMALCPEHDDRNPSLSVKTETDGRVLLNCFAGCATEDVVERLGLRMRDLFPVDVSDSGRRPPEPRRRDFAGNARVAAEMLFAVQRLGQRWGLALWLDECPNCEWPHLQVSINQSGEVRVYCDRGCTAPLILRALADRLSATGHPTVRGSANRERDLAELAEQIRACREEKK